MALINNAANAAQILFDAYTYLCKKMPSNDRLTGDGQMLLASMRGALADSYDTTGQEIEALAAEIESLYGGKHNILK